MPEEQQNFPQSQQEENENPYEEYGMRRVVGVPPMPEPWPEDPRYDRELLADGDRRNVADRYRYWSVEAIKEELASRSSTLHIAIENLQHDLNIGSIVRSANAFNIGGVHIVGRRRWNRRGALVTDKYINIMHHETPESLQVWAREHDYHLIAVDNPPESLSIEESDMPQKSLLVFGQESAGISEELLSICESAIRIEQYGSTRSLNVAAAAGIAMHWWTVQHKNSFPPAP